MSRFNAKISNWQDTSGKYFYCRRPHSFDADASFIIVSVLINIKTATIPI